MATAFASPRAAGDRGARLDAFVLVQQALEARQQVWGRLKGQPVRICPHTLGWRAAEPYVLGLVVHPRREPAEGAGWEWLMEWQWIRLADLEEPFACRADWVTCPKEQRPDSRFLTHVYLEAA